MERCFTPISTLFLSYHGDSSHNDVLHQYWARAVKCLACKNSQEKPRRSSAAQTKNLQATCHTPYLSATQDLKQMIKTIKKRFTSLRVVGESSPIGCACIVNRSSL